MLGLTGKDLAKRFQALESLCGCIFLTWLRACAKVFGSMVFIPDEESLIATKPSRFQQFQNLHSIIDCTEIFIETPKNLQLQSATWSDYKHQKHYEVTCCLLTEQFNFSLCVPSIHRQHIGQSSNNKRWVFRFDTSVPNHNG